MEKSSIAVATITWARDEEEENLLRASLPYLAETGLPVFITDGGSPPAFIEFLNSFPQFTVLLPKEKGLWAQAKYSIINAQRAETPFILYTEPDKQEFFSNSLKPLVMDYPNNDQTGIVLAARTRNAFRSFPAFQQMTETTINNCCAEITGSDHDYTYGPFLMNSRLVPYLQRVNHNIGWGWRPYAFCIAHRLGYSTQSYRGDFFCPTQQRQDNQKERLYRMKQLQENIEGIVLASTISLDR